MDRGFAAARATAPRAAHDRLPPCGTYPTASSPRPRCAGRDHRVVGFDIAGPERGTLPAAPPGIRGGSGRRSGGHDPRRRGRRGRVDRRRRVDVRHRSNRPRRPRRSTIGSTRPIRRRSEPVARRIVEDAGLPWRCAPPPTCTPARWTPIGPTIPSRCCGRRIHRHRQHRQPPDERRDASRRVRGAARRLRLGSARSSPANQTALDAAFCDDNTRAGWRRGSEPGRVPDRLEFEVGARLAATGLPPLRPPV